MTQVSQKVSERYEKIISSWALWMWVGLLNFTTGFLSLALPFDWQGYPAMFWLIFMCSTPLFAIYRSLDRAAWREPME